MRFIFILALMVVNHAGASTASQYKGFEATQRLIDSRLMAPGQSLNLPKYLPGMSTGYNSIFELLGTYTTQTGIHTYKNGEPNSVNVLLWYVLLNSLGAEVGSNCVASTGLQFHPRFLQRLAAICAWPAASAKDEKVMRDFWISIMGYDAPITEYTGWRDFFLNSTYQSRPAKEAVAAMTYSILMNPYFLLER